MSSASLLSLSQNIALLLALVLLFDSMSLRMRNADRKLYQIGMGLLIGGIGLVIMLTPWVMIPGVVFDTRSVLLGISGLFFGALPTLIAMAVTIAFRFVQGGGGTKTGSLVILATGSMGIAWNYLRRHSLENTPWWEFYVFGLASHVVMLALMFTLPWETALSVLSSIVLPVLLLYPFGTVLLGGLMVRRLQREKASAILQESEDTLRQLAQELMQSRDLLARSQEIAHIGTWELDLNSGRLIWTDEVFRIFGLEPQEFSPTYKAFLEYVHPDDRATVDQVYSTSVVNGSHSYDIEHRVIRRSSGEERFVHEKCVHTRDASGAVIRSLGMVQDITERKQAEDSLKANQAELRRLLQEADQSRLTLLSVLEDRLDTAAGSNGSGHVPPS